MVEINYQKKGKKEIWKERGVPEDCWKAKLKKEKQKIAYLFRKILQKSHMLDIFI